MLCKYPFIRDPSGKVFKSTNKEDWLKGIPFPCGQCLPCRINKRRVWSTRLWLEAMSHSDNLPMILLTYSDDELPLTLDGRPSLCKRDIQLYLKRLRKYGLKFRYYIAGEYGPETNRPHYHAVFFGISPIYADKVCETWPHGIASLGYDNSFESYQYVAGYVTKKIVVKRDMNDTRVPEFALMSRKPAIGSMALNVIITTLNEHPDIIQSVLSNPSLRLNGHYSPIGRTLADKLRSAFDSDFNNDAFLFEMRKLWKESLSTYNINDDDFHNGPLVSALLAESKQRNIQIAKHYKIFNKRNSV